MSTAPTNPLGFPPHLRLTRKHQFDRVFDARCSVAAFPLRLYGRPNHLTHPRLGLIVTRRVGSAVVRNRLKRLLRESFRLLQHDLPPGYDLVVLASPHALRPLAEYQRLLADAAAEIERKWTRRSTT